MVLNKKTKKQRTVPSTHTRVQFMYLCMSHRYVYKLQVGRKNFLGRIVHNNHILPYYYITKLIKYFILLNCTCTYILPAFTLEKRLLPVLNY